MEVAETACWDMADIWFGIHFMMTLPIVLPVICFMIIESAETNKQIDYIEDNQLSDFSLSVSVTWRVYLDFVTNSTSTLFVECHFQHRPNRIGFLKMGRFGKVKTYLSNQHRHFPPCFYLVIQSLLSTPKRCCKKKAVSRVILHTIRCTNSYPIFILYETSLCTFPIQKKPKHMYKLSKILSP
jgi:hypothetical protein